MFSDDSIIKSTYYTAILERLFIPGRRARQRGLAQVKTTGCRQSSHLHLLAPASVSAPVDRPPVLGSLSQLAPITRNEPVKALFVHRTKRSKIFGFFSIDDVFFCLSPAPIAPALAVSLILTAEFAGRSAPLFGKHDEFTNLNSSRRPPAFAGVRLCRIIRARGDSLRLIGRDAVIAVGTRI